MGCHLLKSVILKATAQCAVFSGDPPLKGEAQMTTVFYEAVEIILGFFVFLFLKILFIWQREREHKQRKQEREKQSPR